MKLLAILFSVCSIVSAESLDLNGGFEKVVPDRNGFAMPTGWLFMHKISKKSAVRVLRDSGTFRSGSFGLMVECEKNGRFYMRWANPIPVQVGDRIEYSVYAKGEGNFTFGFIINGIPESAPKSKSQFIRTITGKMQKASKSDQWQSFTVALTVGKQQRKKVVYSNYTILPVIYAENDAELFLDDLSAVIIRKDAK